MRKRFAANWPILVVLGVVSCQAQERPNYDLIDKNLFLGAFVKAPPPGTKAVLNLCETEDPYKVPAHRWVPINDVEPAPNLAWLKEQVDFIDAQLQSNHQTYVHCRNGVNRSGFVVTAYLMYSRKLTRDEALRLIRAKRPDVRPNAIFMERLLEWEKTVTKSK